MADDQTKPPATPLSTPTSTASLDDVLSSLEQQISTQQPAAVSTAVTSIPLKASLTPTTSQDATTSPPPMQATQSPPSTLPTTAPALTESPITPQISSTPDSAGSETSHDLPAIESPFVLEEKHVAQVASMPTVPVASTVASDTLREHPAVTIEAPAASPAPTDEHAPQKQGFFSFLNPKIAVAGTLALFLIVGSVAAFVLSGLNQDLRQKAAGISCGAGTCNDGWSYGEDCNAPQSSCSQRATEACATHGGPASGGGPITCGGNPTNPPGGGGGSNVCYPNSPSSIACRNGNTFGSPCTNFAGTCQKGAQQSNGQYACACVPTQALPNGSSCTAHANCLSGYCDPDSKKCANTLIPTCPTSECGSTPLTGGLMCKKTGESVVSYCCPFGWVKSGNSCVIGNTKPSPTPSPIPGGPSAPPGSTCGGNNQACCDPFSSNGTICYNNLYCNTATGKCQSSVPAGICQVNGGTPSGMCEVYTCGNACNNGAECNLNKKVVPCAGATLEGQCGQIDYLNTSGAYCGVKVQNCGGSCRGTSTPPPTTPKPTPTPTPVAKCGSTCTSNAQCPTGLICSAGKCRNSACTSSSTCVCATATPTPTPSPTPTSTPLAPVCLRITRDVTTPQVGSQVRFTCGTVAGVDRYEFRYKYTFAGGPELGGTLAATGNISNPLLIEYPGTYKVQCRPCIGQLCSEWESW